VKEKDKIGYMKTSVDLRTPNKVDKADQVRKKKLK
jgi:hypothetical protein